MASLLHEALVELIAEHPELLLPALQEQLGVLHPNPDVELRCRRGEASQSRVPPLRADLGLEFHRPGESDPFAAITIEIQLSKDDDKPFSWLLYHAGQHYCLRVPSFLLVVTNDPVIAAWAAGPFRSGMVTMRPLVVGPTQFPPVTDPEEAKRSLERTLLSGLVHANEPVAVDIGIALAVALDASPDDTGLYYWDTLLAALGDALRSTLEMQLEHWKPRSEWGKRLYADGQTAGLDEGRAEGMAEGKAEGKRLGKLEFLAELLSKRGLAIDDELRARLDHCTDEAQLQRWFDRALTATTVAAVFAEP